MLLERRAPSRDPLVSSRMVAKSLLSTFRVASPHETSKLSIETMLRLLKKYETGSFDSYRPTGIGDRSHVGDLNSRLSTSGQTALQTVIGGVHQVMAPDKTAPVFATSLARSFEALKERRAAEGDVMVVRDFLERLATALESR